MMYVLASIATIARTVPFRPSAILPIGADAAYPG